MLPRQRAQRRRREPARRRRKNRHRDVADHLAVRGVEIRRGALERGEHATGVLDQQARRVGEPHAAALAREQLMPDFLLELRQLLRHRRGRHVQRFGGGLHAAERGDGVQRAETVDVQHVQIF